MRSSVAGMSVQLFVLHSTQEHGEALESLHKANSTSEWRKDTETDADMATERLSSMEENLMFLRKALNEEIQMRHDIIGELGSLKKRNQVCILNDVGIFYDNL